jgi:hypothetical protein
MHVREKYQYQQAYTYAAKLTGVLLHGVVLGEELPAPISPFIQQVIRIESVPVRQTALAVSVAELTDWVERLLPPPTFTRLLFKPSGLYWKFWLDLTLVNRRSFISSYLASAPVKDFCLADRRGQVMQAFLETEDSFDFFEHSFCASELTHQN